MRGRSSPPSHSIKRRGGVTIDVLFERILFLIGFTLMLGALVQWAHLDSPKKSKNRFSRAYDDLNMDIMNTASFSTKQALEMLAQSEGLGLPLYTLTKNTSHRMQDDTARTSLPKIMMLQGNERHLRELQINCLLGPPSVIAHYDYEKSAVNIRVNQNKTSNASYSASFRGDYGEVRCDNTHQFIKHTEHRFDIQQPPWVQFGKPKEDKAEEVALPLSLATDVLVLNIHGVGREQFELEFPLTMQVLRSIEQTVPHGHTPNTNYNTDVENNTNTHSDKDNNNKNNNVEFQQQRYSHHKNRRHLKQQQPPTRPFTCIAHQHH
eukprot:m.233676 g.233676  ORF g.233676 m.233676 type:complete len:321 (-) comp33645_c3_seq2:1138-2100(-)